MKRLISQSAYCLLVPLLFACKPINSGIRGEKLRTVTNPEEVLPDNVNANTFQDGSVTVTARKGTIAASVRNAQRLGDPSCTPKEREDILDWFKEYATTLAVLFQGQIRFTNAELQEILDRARAEIDAQNGMKR